jgi:DNA-binding NtrC family response regulator
MVGGILLTSTVTVNRAAEGLELLRVQDFDVVLVSFPLSDWAGLADSGVAPAMLLEELQRAQPGTPVILHAPSASATEVVRLLRLGAFHVYARAISRACCTWLPIPSGHRKRGLHRVRRSPGPGDDC